MGWDVIVQNFRGRPPEDELQDGEPLGTPAAIRKSIDKYLPGTVWSDPLNGIYDGGDFSIEFSIGDTKPVLSMMLSVRGGGDAFAAMKSLAVPNKWSLFDCSEGDFLDLEQSTAAGFEEFQEYRDRVIPKKRQQVKSSPKGQKRKTSAPKKAAKWKAPRKSGKS